jgi:hypothetical protein
MGAVSNEKALATAAQLVRKALEDAGADPGLLDEIMPGLEAGARQMLATGDYSAQGEAQRSDGRWVSAGVGLAGHLHGQQVTGQRRGGGSGSHVHGTYLGGGVVEAGKGERVPVAAVRPHETPGPLPGG